MEWAVQKSSQTSSKVDGALIGTEITICVRKINIERMSYKAPWVTAFKTKHDNENFEENNIHNLAKKLSFQT